MPAAVAVPAIAAVVGAGISAYSNSRATDTQAKSADKALQFERDQEAERRREWDYQQAQAKIAWEARQKMLAPFLAGGASVLAKYGIKAPPDASPPAALPYAGGSSVGPPAMPNVPGVSAPQMSAPQMPSPVATADEGTIGHMMQQPPVGTSNPTQNAFDWNDWSRYGAPNA